MQRRGLCWSCYRKLREANLPLPLRVCDRESDPLEAWATVLPLSSVKRLLTVLAVRERVLVTKIEAIAAALASGAAAAELARRRREREREENSPSAA